MSISFYMSFFTVFLFFEILRFFELRILKIGTILVQFRVILLILLPTWNSNTKSRLNLFIHFSFYLKIRYFSLHSINFTLSIIKILIYYLWDNFWNLHLTIFLIFLLFGVFGSIILILFIKRILISYGFLIYKASIYKVSIYKVSIYNASIYKVSISQFCINKEPIWIRLFSSIILISYIWVPWTSFMITYFCLILFNLSYFIFFLLLFKILTFYLFQVLLYLIIFVIAESAVV